MVNERPQKICRYKCSERRYLFNFHELSVKAQGQNFAKSKFWKFDMDTQNGNFCKESHFQTIIFSIHFQFPGCIGQERIPIMPWETSHVPGWCRSEEAKHGAPAMSATCKRESFEKMEKIGNWSARKDTGLQKWKLSFIQRKWGLYRDIQTVFGGCASLRAQRLI